MLQAEMYKLREVGIDPEKFKGYQVLCLPENAEYAKTADELFDASDTADLSKQLRAVGLKCANSFDLGIKAKVRERRGAELWLGLVWILDNVALPVFIDVVSTKLASMIHRKAKSTSAIIQQSGQKVHLKLRILRGEDFISIDYDGDPEILNQMLSGIGKNIEDKDSKK